MLQLDFYASGKGETIVITFPDGKLGIVDAHPAAGNIRPSIAQLVSGKQVNFVCLTHPHEDHGLDMLSAIGASSAVDHYWHTVGDVQSLIFSVTQQERFLNRHTPLLEELRKGWAEFLLDLYDEVGKRSDANPAFLRRINSSRSSEEFGAVRVHFLGPSEDEQNKYGALWRDRLAGKHRRKPDENALSAILALEYGEALVVLGADALTHNWIAAVEKWKKAGLPRAALLKVPHHGGSNAFGGGRDGVAAMFKKDKGTMSVLFGGDIKHPSREVHDALKEKTRLLCVANGRKGPSAHPNPLKLHIPGAIAVGDSCVCNPRVSVQISAHGALSVPVGQQCSFCCSEG